MSATGKRKRRSRQQSGSGAQKPGALTPAQVEEVLAGGALDGLTRDSLTALGVLTPKGGASPSAHRKLKQVNHFLQLLAPAMDELFERYPNPIIVDMGAGKAAMSLAIYDRWIRAHGRGEMIIIESRPELVHKVKEVTGTRYPQLEAQASDILNATLPERVHLTLGLHACDLATDHAIYRALLAKSDHVALVPCCQAELAQLLKPIKQAPLSLSSLWADGWHRREFGSHLTNVMRALSLRARGYAVTVTELIGWEHSVKNELILGRRVARYHAGAHAELNGLLEAIPVQPWLISQLSAMDKRLSSEASQGEQEKAEAPVSAEEGEV